MKKIKLITTLLTISAVACTIVAATACEGTHETPPHTHNYDKVVTDNTFQYVCSCGEKQNGYFVQLIYQEDGSEVEAGISVVWTDTTTGEQVSYGSTNDRGEVAKTHLTAAEYGIHMIEGDPENGGLPVINGIQYSYDKQAFQTQQNGVGLIIPLFPVNQPSNANKIITGTTIPVTGRYDSTKDTGDVYSISLEKTYVATLNSATDAIWYSVQNEGLGKYTVSVNTAADVIATFERHASAGEYINPEEESNVDKSVKNKFTYTVVESDATQNSCFRIQAPAAEKYPVYIPFSVEITFTPTYDKAQDIFVAPTHFETKESKYSYIIEDDRTGAKEISVDSLIPVEGVTKCLDVENAAILDLTADDLKGLTLKDDGYFYTSENKLVYAKINTASIFEGNTLANRIQTGDATIYHIVEVESEYKYVTKRSNYFGFVQAYSALCNSDGVYPLTEELKDYLSLMCTNEHRGLEEMLCFYEK